MDVKALTGDTGGSEFYPTPKELVEKMVADINWNMVNTILEPSAGKGDILDALKEVEVVVEKRHNWRYKPFDNGNIDIDCVEVDTNLQHILRGKGYRVVHDDFLTFHTYKKYDLIIMNPPFSCADQHLAKAMQMQRNGGSIVCLMNAETIKNPYTNLRKELVKKLDEYQADISFIKHAFSGAERKTDVEIAVVKVSIPQKEEPSEIYENLKKAAQHEEYNAESGTDLVLGDYIKAAVSMFNVEVASGIELIRQYKNLEPYILDSFEKESDTLRNPILELRVFGDNHKISVNSYVEQVRLKYWKGLFMNPLFTGNFTSNLIRKYNGLVDGLKDYDFSEHNINMIMLDMRKKMKQSIEDTIMKMFDRLSAQHSWYKETANNIHYYNGWATNKAHKVNKKVILPCYGVFSSWNNSFQSYQAVDTLRDIEKIFDFFDGNMTSYVDMYKVVNAAQENPKNIECKYFTVTFYKKGTVHITFRNLDLLEKFNIYAAKNRRWLPPDYGKKQYKDMSREEQVVVDEFQGEEAYSKVMENQNYFLVETQDMLQIGCA